MQRELDEAVRSLTKQRVMEALLAGRSLELPSALVEREVQRSMAAKRLELAHSGYDVEKIELDKQAFEEPARRRVSLGLLIAELIKENGIKADPEEVRARVDGIASTYEDPQGGRALVLLRTLSACGCRIQRARGHGGGLDPGESRDRAGDQVV